MKRDEEHWRNVGGTLEEHWRNIVECQLITFQLYFIKTRQMRNFYANGPI